MVGGDHHPLPVLPHSLSHSRTHSLAHAPTHSLKHSRTHLHTHSLTHALTHSLTHTHTHSLTHALTHSRSHPLHAAADELPGVPPERRGGGGLRRGYRACGRGTPYTLHPTPYTLHPTPFTLNPTPHTQHPAPYTLHLTPYTMFPTPYEMHPTPCTLYLHTEPSTLTTPQPLNPGGRRGGSVAGAGRNGRGRGPAMDGRVHQRYPCAGVCVPVVRGRWEVCQLKKYRQLENWPINPDPYTYTLNPRL